MAERIAKLWPRSKFAKQYGKIKFEALRIGQIIAHRSPNNAWYAEQLGVSTRTVRTCLYERQKFYFHVHDDTSGPEKVKFLRTMRFQDEHFRGRIKKRWANRETRASDFICKYQPSSAARRKRFKQFIKTKHYVQNENTSKRVPEFCLYDPGRQQRSDRCNRDKISNYTRSPIVV